MDEIARAVIVGTLSGVISPLVLAWIQHKAIWKSQKKLEIKYSIFNDAVKALSLYATDALDPKLQSNKQSYAGASRAVEARPETFELMEHSRGMVKAFFTQASYDAYDEALRAKISLDTIPNLDFEKKRTEAILAIGKELGVITK